MSINFDDNSSRQLKIYDVNGRVILNRTLENSQNQMDLSGQPKGVYFISVTSDGKEVSNKLILE